MKLRPLTVIGLNSGTSMDGVDAALFRISPLPGSLPALNLPAAGQGRSPGAVSGAVPGAEGSRLKLSIEMLGQELLEFEPALRRKMKSLLASGQVRLEELTRLDAVLGEEFARAARKLMRSTGASSLDVDLIGSHGQTIWHAPERKKFGSIECAGTMQLGQIAIIAERTGIPVIGDFRVQDMAAGGQGAPLVSFLDEVLFGTGGEAIGILNIGGIANITVLDESGAAILAFDTGPGNMLVDRSCERLFAREFDHGGELALQGQVDQDFLEEILQLPYFSLAAPKTTGREMFGTAFADTLIERGLKLGLDKLSVLASITALTPVSICRQYELLIKPKLNLKKIVVSGGGCENKFMLQELARAWPHDLQVMRHEDYGVSSKFKEALLFAMLAYTSYFRIPNNVPACTGAARRVCLGRLCLPSKQP